MLPTAYNKTIRNQTWREDLETMLELDDEDIQKYRRAKKLMRTDTSACLPHMRYFMMVFVQHDDHEALRKLCSAYIKDFSTSYHFLQGLTTALIDRHPPKVSNKDVDLLTHLMELHQDNQWEEAVHQVLFVALNRHDFKLVEGVVGYMAHHWQCSVSYVLDHLSPILTTRAKVAGNQWAKENTLVVEALARRIPANSPLLNEFPLVKAFHSKQELLEEISPPATSKVHKM